MCTKICSLSQWKEKNEGGHHPGKYADGAVDFAPAMFEEALVISAKHTEQGMCLKFAYSLKSSLLSDIFFTFVQVHAGYQAAQRDALISSLKVLRVQPEWLPAIRQGKQH